MLRTIVLSLLVSSSLLIAVPVQARLPTVTGTVSYPQPESLPADALLSVSLQDIADPGAPVTLVHTDMPLAGRKVPVPFILTYRISEIDQTRFYAVSAVIKSGGKLLFKTTQSYPVITRGAPTQLALTLQPADTMALEETYWKLIAIRGRPAMAGAGAREVHLSLRRDGHKLEANGGCNYILGDYELAGDALRLRLGAATKMMCAEAVMKQERALSKALPATRSYRIAGNKLALLDGRKVVAQFVAQDSGQH